MQLGSHFPFVGGPEKNTANAEIPDASADAGISFGDVLVQSQQAQIPEHQTDAAMVFGAVKSQTDAPQLSGKELGGDLVDTMSALETTQFATDPEGDGTAREAGIDLRGGPALKSDALAGLHTGPRKVAATTMSEQNGATAPGLPAGRQGGAGQLGVTGPNPANQDLGGARAALLLQTGSEAPQDAAQKSAHGAVTTTPAAKLMQVDGYGMSHVSGAGRTTFHSSSGEEAPSEAQLAANAPPSKKNAAKIPLMTPVSANEAESFPMLPSEKQLREIAVASNEHRGEDSLGTAGQIRDKSRLIVGTAIPGDFTAGAKVQLPQDMTAVPNIAVDGPVAADVVSEMVVSDVRAAETLTARAEISGHLRTELPRHIAVQLADVARLQPDRPVELTLSPEELGRLRLTFSGDLSAMTVSVNVERPETLDLMRRHIDLLAQEMRDIGYGEVSFSFEHSGADSGGQGTEKNSDQITPAGAERDEDGALPHAASSVQLTLSGGTGIDIRL